MKRYRFALFLVLSMVALIILADRAKLASAADQPPPPPQHHGGPPPASAIGTTAVANLKPANPKSKLAGTITFTQEMGGVRIVADVSGLKSGKHGFHIHENGECTDSFKSAGDHLNTYKLDHSCPPEQLRHLGDLGNIEVGPDGKGHYDQLVDKISVVDPHHLIVGKAVIVHAGPDDCKAQPAGGSGDRIACGVIQLAHH